MARVQECEQQPIEGEELQLASHLQEGKKGEERGKGEERKGGKGKGGRGEKEKGKRRKGKGEGRRKYV
ncbi:hypothetical protein, partial [Staphylococcus aureus]|uniref:hypothetical protein n=1 Tax=Staphylococcus aureus TaxID=1280 RepID=UPI0019158E45